MGNKPIKKENTLLNIYVCNFNNEIQDMKFLEKNLEIQPKEYTHKFYGWKFYDYGNNLNEDIIADIINKLKDCKKIFQNVLLIYDDKPNNEYNKSLYIMKQLVRNTNDILFQPLLIYVSNSIDKNTSYYRNILRSFILQENIEETEEYDELNIYSFLYENNNFINKLINELWQCTIYFNQIPSMYLPMTQESENFEIRVQKLPFTINILLAGENGTGKSTFINILNNRKTAYESDNGVIRTNKLTEYLISIKEKDIKNIINDNSINLNRVFNYKICDTMGFSLDNKELKELINYIKEFSDESTQAKDSIHCILYFLTENNYKIYNGVVREFFKYIYIKKIKVIFVINFNDGKKHFCKKKLKINFKLGFSEEENNFFFENNDENIIELNLKNLNGNKIFGINKLMEKLEILFQKFLIQNINELNNQGYSCNDLLNIINKYPLYKDLKTIDDLCIKLISQAKKLISYSLPIIIGISFIPIPGVDDAIALSIESGLIMSIGNIFGENLSKRILKKYLLI